MPPHRILSLSDSRPIGFQQVTTITNEERVNNWHKSIVKKLKKLIGNTEEEVLHTVIADYIRLISPQIKELKERPIFKERIGEHLYSLHFSYGRQRLPLNSSKYFDSMERIVGVACDLELEVVSSIAHTSVALSTQTLINLLHIHLNNQLTRILHVLLRLDEKYIDKQPYRMVMNTVYKHFLVILPVLNKSDLNFCLYYLIYQKWKKTRPECEHLAMDKCMYLAFDKTAQAIAQSKLLQRILKPTYEAIRCVDDHVNGVEARILQYFKYYDQTQAKENNNSQSTQLKKQKSEDPYEMEFVQSTMYIKTQTLTNTQGSEYIISIIAKADEVVLIDDDEDDSDVEIVPVVETENVTSTTLSGEVSPTLEKEKSHRLESIDALKLIPLFEGINCITSINDINMEKDQMPFIDTNIIEKEKSEHYLELAIFLKSVSDSQKSKTSDKTDHDLKDTITKKYSFNQKINKMKLTKMKDIVTHEITKKKNSESSAQTELTQSENKQSKVNQEIQSLQVKQNDCHTCQCQHATKSQNISVQPQNEQIVLKPTSKNAEMQTESDDNMVLNLSSIQKMDNGIIITNVSDCRGLIDTPPSDLEPGNLTANNLLNYNSFSFTTTLNEYVKEDSPHGMAEQCEVDSMPVLNAYSNGLDVVQENGVKTHDETFDGYPYASEMEGSTSLIPGNDIQEASHLQLMDMDDTIKMPLLENETDSKNHSEEHDCNEASTSVNSEASADATDNSAAASNCKVVAAVDVKKRISRKHNKSPSKPRKTKKNKNAYLAIESDQCSSQDNEIEDAKEDIEQSSHDDSRSTNVAHCSKSNLEGTIREFSPSPPYEVISPHDLKKHLKEVKKGQKRGILKSSNSSFTCETTYSSTSTINQDSIKISFLRKAVTTRASTKRKPTVNEDETPTKKKKVNFVERDTIVPIPREQPQQIRRVSNSIIEQVKDSLYVNNIYKQDNKLIFLEPCIPISIKPFSKFVEEHKARQVNTYNKTTNIFFKKPICMKDDAKCFQRIDYKKSGDSLSPNTPTRYSTITFRTASDKGFSKTLLFGDRSIAHGFSRTFLYGGAKSYVAKSTLLTTKKEYATSANCGSMYEDIIKKQPKVVLQWRSAEELLQLPKYGNPGTG